MGFSLASFKRGLPWAAAAGLAVYSAQAQRSVFRGGQPILFSEPASDTVASNTPSLTPQPPESLDLSDAAQAPLSMNFNRLPDNAPLPSVMPMLLPGDVERERVQEDRRRNWALLTPAEIIGVVTPEQILGITERDAFGQPKYSTALERYADRQNRLLLLAKTNALPVGNTPSAWSYPGAQREEANPLLGPREIPDAQTGWRFKPAPNNPAPDRPNENSAWSRLFDTTPAALTPITTLSQDDNMDRFRQLLNPSPASAVAAAASGSGGLKTSLPQALLGSGLAQAQPSRLGASFAPLTSGIGRPTGLPKLTGAWVLSYTSSPPTAVWGPPAAPWLSPAAPPAAPQRRF